MDSNRPLGKFAIRARSFSKWQEDGTKKWPTRLRNGHRVVLSSIPPRSSRSTKRNDSPRTNENALRMTDYHPESSSPMIWLFLYCGRTESGLLLKSSLTDRMDHNQITPIFKDGYLTNIPLVDPYPCHFLYTDHISMLTFLCVFRPRLHHPSTHHRLPL